MKQQRGRLVWPALALAMSAMAACAGEIGNEEWELEQVELSSDALSATDYVLADTFVRDGKYATINYGTDTTLQARQYSTDWRRRAYVKLDLSRLSGKVSSARLRLFGRLSIDSPGLQGSVAAFSAGSIDWRESQVVWSNAPALSTQLDVRTVRSATDAWYEWDVTGAVNRALDRNWNVVTIALQSSQNTDAAFRFSSREAASNKPRLVLPAASPAPAPAPTTPPVVTPAPAPSPKPSPASILWTDDIQTTSSNPWGFSQITIERPIGTRVNGSSQANLSRVANPIGDGFALKHIATFDGSGSRSQAGIYSFADSTFNDLVKSREGVWVAQEWYFPQRITANSSLDSQPWVNLWDWHSVGGDRWDTQPGLMLAENGSMRVKWTWRKENPETGWSTLELPVGRWFDVEMHYVWTDAHNGTVSLWIDGKLALEQQGVRTKGSGHNSVEMYAKFYGSSNGGSTWSPTPSVKYTRNVRMARERIWR